MFICICNGHRERDIRAAAEAGLTCAREIYRHLGKPVRCGRCLETAAVVIDEVHQTGRLAVAANADDIGARDLPTPQYA
jgi:bacterioferritin-associated ferredoxin